MSKVLGFFKYCLLPCLLGLIFAVTVPVFAIDTSSAPNVKVRQSQSSNWAGYAVATSLSNPQKQAVHDVKGDWVVPALTCNTDEDTYASAWVGIDGYSNRTVEQIGTEHDCIDGQARYYAWFEMYPKPAYRILTVNVNAGDAIRGRVAYTGDGWFQLSIQNLTTGQSFSTMQRMKRAARQSAEWVVEAPFFGGTLPLANFGTIQFSNAETTINSHTGDIDDPNWQNDPITMITSNGDPKAVPSSLSAGGSSFNIEWQSN